MLVVMQEGASEEQIQKVTGRLVEMGFTVHRSTRACCTRCWAAWGRRIRLNRPTLRRWME